MQIKAGKKPPEWNGPGPHRNFDDEAWCHPACTKQRSRRSYADALERLIIQEANYLDEAGTHLFNGLERLQRIYKRPGMLMMCTHCTGEAGTDRVAVQSMQMREYPVSIAYVCQKCGNTYQSDLREERNHD